MYVAVALTVLIMIGGVTWYMLTRDTQPDPQQQVNTTDNPPSRTDTTPPATTDDPPPATEDPQAERIKRLLTQAGTYMEQGQFLSPPDRNAFTLYQQVLTIDPDNADAKLGMGTLANQLESRIEQMLSRGEQGQARQLVSQAIGVFPNNLGIRYLHETLIGGDIVVDTTVNDDPPQTTDPIITTTEPTQTNQTTPPSGEVLALLERADNYFDQNIMSFPPGKNAMDLYLEVVKIDPNNARANEQLEFIANMWALTAEGKIDEGSLTMAKRMIARGLKARPNHPRLLELQSRID